MITGATMAVGNGGGEQEERCQDRRDRVFTGFLSMSENVPLLFGRLGTPPAQGNRP